MGQETDKLLKLRTTQYNVLKARGIDFIFIMKIFEKYEKKQPVSDMEAEQYNRAMKILRNENCADVFLNKYYKMDEEDLKVLREKFKDTIREYQQKDGQAASAVQSPEGSKERQSGFGMQPERGEPRKSKPPEKPGPGKKGQQKPKKKKSEWDGYAEANPGAAKKKALIVVGVLLLMVILYMIFSEDEATKKKREAAEKRAQEQQVQKPARSRR